MTAPDHRIERLVFFSDAVFAIAITLLVIELRPPHLPAGASAAAHGRALAALAPSLLGFVISFFAIGAFWAGHHRMFTLAARWSDRLVLADLLLLFTIVAMPFFTAYLGAGYGSAVPVLLYAGWLLLAALFNIRLQGMVTSPPIVSDDADPARIATIRHRGRAVALGAATTLVLAAVLPVPSVALFALMTIPLWRPLLDRLAAKRQPDQADERDRRPRALDDRGRQVEVVGEADEDQARAQEVAGQRRRPARVGAAGDGGGVGAEDQRGAGQPDRVEGGHRVGTGSAPE